MVSCLDGTSPSVLTGELMRCAAQYHEGWPGAAPRHPYQNPLRPVRACM